MFYLCFRIERQTTSIKLKNIMKAITELKKGDSIKADGRLLTVLKTEDSTFKSGCKSLRVYFVEGGSLKYKLDKTFKIN